MKTKTYFFSISHFVLLFVLIVCSNERSFAQSYNTWSQTNGPFGGTIFGIAVNPSNAKELVVATAFNGCFRSTNDGINWFPIRQGLPDPRVTCITPTMSNGSTMYIGLPQGFGVYKSLNNGANWSAANNSFPSNAVVYALRIDPSSANIVYAATSVGMYRTTDAGRGWTAINTGITATDVRSVIIHPTTFSTVYCGTRSGGVYKSTNSGSSWTLSNTGISSSAITQDFVFDPANSSTMYIGTTQGVYKSVNGGAIWNSTNSGMTNTSVRGIAILSSSTLLAVTGGGGVFKTTNSGTNWASANAGIKYSTLRSIAVLPGSTTTLFVSADDADGFFKTSNAGGIWTTANTDLVATDILQITSNINALYCIASSNGIYRSTNKGTNWVQSASGINSLAGISMIATDPSNPNTLYAATIDGVYKTNVGGVGSGAWGLKNAGLATTNIGTVAVHPSSTSTIYAGTFGSGIFRSVNGGDSWGALNTGLPSGANTLAYAISKYKPDYMYASIDVAGTGSDGVYHTNNGGNSWIRQATGLPATTVTSIAIDPANASNVFIGTSNAGVYKTTNAGGTWTQSTSGITTTSIRALAISSDKTPVLYAATGNGVFRSTDEGGSWELFTAGMFNTNVNDIILDVSNPNNLYAAMYGSGVLNNQLMPSISGGSSVNFGTVAVNQSSDQSYIIANKGYGTLSVTSVSITGPHATQFNIVSGGGAFQLGELVQRTITLRFRPTSDGVKNATLRIVSNAIPQDPFDVPLTGFGSSALISASVTSIDFADVNIGSSSDQSVKITNTGAVALTISDQRPTTGDADQFEIIQKIPSTINPGNSATMVIRFTPTSGGAKSSILRILSNASNEPTKDIILKGNGKGNAQITLSTNILSFGSVGIGNMRELSVEVVNSGNGELNISNVLLAGADVSQFGLTPPSSTRLQPNEKTIIKVTFQPTSAGAKSAALRIISDAINQPTAIVTLTGSSAGTSLITSSVPKLDFGAINVGGLAEQSVTITNTGVADLLLTGQTITGVDPSQFTITRLSKSTLTPNESDFITIRFAPTSNGSKQAALRIQSNASNATEYDITLVGIGGGVPAIDLSTHNLDFGGVAVGSSSEKSVQIKNSGVAALTISSQSISGVDASAFTIVRLAPASISPGQTDSVVIRFSPVFSGSKSASLLIGSNASNRPSETVNLFGTGGGTVTIAFSSETVEFGGIDVGSSTEQSLTITNTGSNDLHITGQSLTGTDATMFTITKLCSSTLTPNESDNVTIRFSPSSAGSKSAQLSITSDAVNAPQKTIALTGTGGSVPVISTSAVNIDFGSINTGSSTEQSITIGNAGLSMLTISSQSIQGAHASEFSIVKQCTASLNAGSSDILTIRFQPVSEGNKNATLRIVSNSSGTPTLDIALTGSAGGAPVITLGSTSLDFGLVDYGSSSSLAVAVTNSGVSNLAITDQQIVGTDASEFTIVSATASSLAPNQTDSIRLQFTPLRNGNRSAMLLIMSSDPNPQRDTMSISLIGQGQRDEIAPLITHDASFTPILIGGDVQLQAAASDQASGVSRFEVWYRTGANPWSDVNRLPFTNGAATIPGSFATSEGLDYRIIAEDFAGNIDTAKVGNANYYSVPISVPAATGGGIATPSGATVSAYRIFSIPFELTNKNPNTIFTPLGNYNIRLWRCFELSSGNYVELQNFMNDTTRFLPGRAFFLITRTSALLQNTDGITVGSIDGVVGNTGRIPGWQLPTGWSLIGNPFGFDINRNSLRFENGDTLRDCWYYNGSWVRGDTLKRFEGIAVKTSAATTLRLVENPLGGFNASPSATHRYSRVNSARDWRMQIVARSEDALDAENYFGVAGDARNAEDRYDLSEPPLFPGGVSLYFRNDEISVHDGLAADIRSADGEGAVWNFGVQADPHSAITLDLKGWQAFPTNFRVLLLDLDLHALRDFHDARRVAISSHAGKRNFRLVVGTQEFIQRTLEGYDLSPRVFSLSRNYPNPFSDATTVLYQLPVSSFVRIVLRDMLGRNAKDLLASEQTSGSYELLLHGDDLPPGMYFMEMHAEGLNGESFHATRTCIVRR